MHRIAKSPFKTFISLNLYPLSSKQSPQLLPKIPPSISNPSSSLQKLQLFRVFCSNQAIDYSKEIDEINLKFAEAREEIDAALESKETVYFDEEAECAREASESVFNMFDELLQRLPEKDRLALQRSMGLKMEQLKAEIKQLDD